MGRWFVFGMVLCALGPSPAQAGPYLFGFGPRVGVSLTPHQFVVGGQAHFEDLLPGARLVVPVVEVGLGDNETLLALGGQLTAPVLEAVNGWQPQVGGELTLQRLFPKHGVADSQLGLMGLLAIERTVDSGDRFGIELKFEIIDTPAVKLLTTWTFGS